jgi:hypothetical protein
MFDRQNVLFFETNTYLFDIYHLEFSQLIFFRLNKENYIINILLTLPNNLPATQSVLLSLNKSILSSPNLT